MKIIKNRRFRLQIALVLLFVSQLAGTVGLVSYLSFRSGQKAVNDLAAQLRNELTARIDGELRKYLGSPHDFNQLNGAAFSENSFDIPLLIHPTAVTPKGNIWGHIACFIKVRQRSPCLLAIKRATTIFTIMLWIVGAIGSSC
jgi:hypothetical protein